MLPSILLVVSFPGGRGAAVAAIGARGPARLRVGSTATSRSQWGRCSSEQARLAFLRALPSPIRKPAATSPPIAPPISGVIETWATPSSQMTMGPIPAPEPRATDAFGWVETALRVALRVGAEATATCSLIEQPPFAERAAVPAVF